MNSRVKIVEDILNVKLPLEYKTFLLDRGIISDKRGEVFGHVEGIETDKIPSVIGATKLYKQNYNNITDSEIIISFDDFKARPIILNTENANIYSIDYNEKIKIDESFNHWLDNLLKGS